MSGERPKYNKPLRRVKNKLALLRLTSAEPVKSAVFGPKIACKLFVIIRLRRNAKCSQIFGTVAEVVAEICTRFA